MKLNKKKELAARVLGVGKNRIVFNNERLDEIKEAITKQDIRDLFKNKVIRIKEIKGSKKIVRRTTRRRAGSIKKIVNTRKRDYITRTRKLRSFITELKKKGKISLENYYKLRKEIKAGEFKDKPHMKERIAELLK